MIDGPSDFWPYLLGAFLTGILVLGAVYAITELGRKK